MNTEVELHLEQALAEFKNGKFVIIADDESRENEGDLMLLGESATASTLGFMVRYSSGLICAALTQEIADRLRLPAMVKNNQDEKKTAYTVSVDVLKDHTTGISAQERSNTINALSNPHSVPHEFARPGHVFPLVANPLGLAARRGHTEAGVAMAQLVGAEPVTAISELVNDDGSMMRGEELNKFAAAHNIPIFTVQQLIDYAATRLVITPPAPTPYSWAKLPRASAQWQIAVHTTRSGVEHAILKFGEPSGNTLIRLHSECLTGDALGSARCDCGNQLNQSFTEIEKNGAGYIIYLRDHEGRGIGLAQKIAAYVLQDGGLDTVDANLELGHEADARDWHDAVEIVKNLGVSEVTLLSNNPVKAQALIDHGITVHNQTIQPEITATNHDYLLTKKVRMQHSLEVN
jgi:3,4-dihydroxy 2-butanone 4-phosphate synthase/GTP cyclohydrolase II